MHYNYKFDENILIQRYVFPTDRNKKFLKIII